MKSHYSYRQDAAKRQTAGIRLTHRPKISHLSEGSFLNVVVQIPKFDAKPNPKSNSNPNPMPILFGQMTLRTSELLPEALATHRRIRFVEHCFTVYSLM